MFFFIDDDEQDNPPPRGRRARVGSIFPQVMKEVSPQGFVVTSAGLTAASSRITRSPWAMLFRRFAVACGWAAMIAAGCLIYTHFTQKWTEEGYPTLPVTALSDAVSQKSGPLGGRGGFVPGCPPGQSTPARVPSTTTQGGNGGPGHQSGILDEYES